MGVIMNCINHGSEPSFLITWFFSSLQGRSISSLKMKKKIALDGKDALRSAHVHNVCSNNLVNDWQGHIMQHAFKIRLF